MSIYDLPELDAHRTICWDCGFAFDIDSSPNMILCRECDERSWDEQHDGCGE